jgi:ABC-type polysaccharide/polyol phosphate transport system ATPase subunit
VRLLAGVTAPTVGRVRVRGRIAPLISVGVGFHPELSGRENVFLNGIILGLRRPEIERRFDEIVSFAEVEAFIDTPVKFYSSGMFMRLGFAVSILADPDVLLVDEVLSVGDIGFQLKCMERMAEIRNSGTSLVLVSHNLALIRRLCDRVLVLHEGRARYDGDSGEAIALIHELLEEHHADASTPQLADIESFELRDHRGDPTRSVDAGEIVSLTTDLRLRQREHEIFVGFLMYDEHGSYVYGENARFDAAAFDSGDAAHLEISFAPRLATGTYTVRLVVAASDGSRETWVPKRCEFFVRGRHTVEGIADLSGSFSLRRPSDPAQPAPDSTASPA